MGVNTGHSIKLEVTASSMTHYYVTVFGTRASSFPTVNLKLQNVPLR